MSSRFVGRPKLYAANTIAPERIQDKDRRPSSDIWKGPASKDDSSINKASQDNSQLPAKSLKRNWKNKAAMFSSSEDIKDFYQKTATEDGISAVNGAAPDNKPLKEGYLEVITKKKKTLWFVFSSAFLTELP
jgi:hypothetical protein